MSYFTLGEAFVRQFRGRKPPLLEAMSALGHKRTFCDAGAMSALPPKADIMCADMCADRYVRSSHVTLARRSDDASAVSKRSRVASRNLKRSTSASHVTLRR